MRKLVDFLGEIWGVRKLVHDHPKASALGLFFVLFCLFE